MKATGIVRRIDDLGRVVIPKEIRRTLRIREGDPLEIFTDREGEVILKKYSPISELSAFAREYAESLALTIGETVCVTDYDQIIAAAGSGKKELQNQYVNRKLEEVLKGREVIHASAKEKRFVVLTEENALEYQEQIIYPIVCGGDVIGSVILLGKKKKLGETEEKLIACAADFLGRQMEQ